MTTRSGPGYGIEPVDIGIAATLGCITIAAILRIAGTVAAALAGTPQPRGGIADGLQVLVDPAHPAAQLHAPDLDPVLYWAVVVALVVIAVALCFAGWRILARARTTPRADPARIPGTALGPDVARTASARALLRRAQHLRPSLRSPQPTDLGYEIGTAHGIRMWASVEDSVLVLGPPRSGKGAHIVINAILDAPGAVVTTSTRPDNLTVTLRARGRVGPVAVFDPQRLAPALPDGLRWSPVRGCQAPLTAMIRAAGLAAATGLSAGGVEGGAFWEAKTRTVLQQLLHAAALDGRAPAELFRWTLDPTAAAEAALILTSHPAAAAGWGDSLQATLDSDPRTRDAIWQGVSLSLSALADPRVLDAVTPADGSGLDPARFLLDRGTLYLLATGAGANNAAPLVAALIEDIVETARHLAASRPGARLDPPLLLALDEIGNLAPLPSLPTLMAEGGGTGITTMPVLQSLAQARHRWGDNATTAIWDAAILKVILGGSASTRDLHDLAALIGDRDEVIYSTTLGDRSTRSTQRSIRRVPILPPDVLRTLPFGTALTLTRAAAPIITRLRPWTTRPDATQLQRDRDRIEQHLRVAEDSGSAPPE